MEHNPHTSTIPKRMLSQAMIWPEQVSSLEKLGLEESAALRGEVEEQVSQLAGRYATRSRSSLKVPLRCEEGRQVSQIAEMSRSSLKVRRQVSQIAGR